MSFITDTLDSAAQRITIETAFLPTITIDRPLAQRGQPSPLAALLKPRVTISGQFGDKVLAPYGDPVNHWPAVQMVLLGVAAGLLFVTVRGMR